MYIILEMEAVFDSMGTWLINDVKKPMRLVPLRQKHFTTTIAVVIALVFANIPLFFGTEQVTTYDDSVTFRVYGTWMQLGTQPFVFAGMLSALIFDKNDDFKLRTRVLGFIIAVFNAVQWTVASQQSWLCTAQLIFVSYGMLQVLEYLDIYGSVEFSTALIFARAAENIVVSLASTGTIWTVALILIVAWLDGLVVTLPLSYKNGRQRISMPLSLMYNSTSALIMYSTALESILMFFPGINMLADYTWGRQLFLSVPCVYLAVFWLNRHLPELEQTSGRHLVKKWKKDGYKMKGWRKDTSMSQYVQTLIDRNVFWNSIFICVLWSFGHIFKPSTNVTTLFILTSATKRHVDLSNMPSWN